MTSDKKKRDPVRMWTFIVLALCIVLMVIYVVGDRLTPYTTQARVHAYVVPVAPQVAGRLTSVDVENNQKVKAGQQLFSIDPGSYELAVAGGGSRVKEYGTIDSVGYFKCGRFPCKCRFGKGFCLERGAGHNPYAPDSQRRCGRDFRKTNPTI